MADYVFPTSKSKKYRFPTHTNQLVMDRAQAAASEVFVVVLEPGEAPPMHQHDDTEQVFYITEGKGKLEIGEDDGGTFEVNVGDIVRIPPTTKHRIHCLGDRPLTYIAVDCFPGGRPADEPTWESHVKVVCDTQGWQFEEVMEASK